MFRKHLFKALLLATLLATVLALPALAARTAPELQRPVFQTTPEPLAPDAQPAFKADLSGKNEVPPLATDASGQALFVLVDEAGTLTLHYKITVSNIDNIDAAYIYEGAFCENETAVFTLFDGTGDFDPDNPLEGSQSLTNVQLTELLVGNYYVNVHTTDHPDGEICGRIEAFTPPSNYHAALSGANEVPPVETEASGVALFTLNSALDELSYAVYVRNITGVTAAHIHLGLPGENGPILITLFDGTGTFDPENPVSGDVTLAPQDLLDLLSGSLYVNVHTSENPDGEIRGQITSGPLAFEAKLSGANEVPPVVTDATGRAVMLLEADGTLHYFVSVADIENITAAHIHDGEPGENGPVLFPLFDGTGTFDPENPVSGTLSLTPEQVAELIAGNYYVNVHTEVNPDGEIRGQLQQLEPGDLNAILLGENEVPAVETEASGVAHFTLEEDNLLTLNYAIAVSDIENITAAHLHPGLPGEENPPVVTLFDSEDPRIFDPENPISGQVSLDTETLLELLTGRLYLNVHTEANPDGEIRGQVGGGLHAFEANLSGENEVPPVETSASGRAVAVLDDDMSTLYYRVSVADISNITAAYIQEAPPGENGAMVFTLFGNSGTFDPDNPISGTLTLELTQAATLVAGDYYVNVITEENPEGEIRGQLQLFSPSETFVAELSGENEVPPVETDASGLARFDLGEGLEMLHYYLEVEGLEGITGAHIHRAPAGENGDIVFILFDGTGEFGPGNPISGDLTLGPQDVLDLLTGFFYVNVPTEANPGGEIRGQIEVETQPTGLQLYFPLVFNMFVGGGE